MKKRNYNIIVFCLSALFIMSGWISKPLLSDTKNAVLHFFDTLNIETFIDEVEAASKNLSYKNTLIDTYSLYYRITDTKVVEKEDSTIVRMKNDYLAFDNEKLTDSDFEQMANSTLELKEVTDSLQIPFVYVMVPTKLYFENDSNLYYNYESFSSKLESLDIDVLNLAEKMEEQNLSMEDYYFVTDHHWLPETGFWATNELRKKLTEDYQLTFESQVNELDNYTLHVYEDMFLGSIGKKTGKYFTPLGLDDITMITPDFETNLTVIDDRGTTEGDFQKTLLNTSAFTSDDYYATNPYAAYSYGDFGLQVIKNHFASEDAPEIVVIRDSYACVVTPFLSLGSDTLHILDVRYWEPTESAATISEYIESVDPDCVVILYSLIKPDVFNF